MLEVLESRKKLIERQMIYKTKYIRGLVREELKKYMLLKKQLRDIDYEISKIKIKNH